MWWVWLIIILLIALVGAMFAVIVLLHYLWEQQGRLIEELGTPPWERRGQP